MNIADNMRAGNIFTKIRSLLEENSLQEAMRLCEDLRHKIKSESVHAIVAARIHLHMREFDKARMCLYASHGVEYKDEEAHREIAYIACNLGIIDIAITHLNKVTEINPASPDVYNELCLLYQNNNDSTRALAAGLRAIALSPSFWQAMNNTGIAYESLGDMDAAIRMYKRAIDIEPNNSKIHKNLGVAYINQGMIDDAKRELLHAIELDPLHGEAYRHLFSIKGYKNDNGSLIERVEEIIASHRISEDSLADFHFALGKAYDDTECYDTAFCHYSQGNQIINRTCGFRAERLKERVTGIINTFDSTLLQRFSKYGSSSDKPVFIVGLPRSGTSLLEQILSTHPFIHGAGELRDIGTYAAQLQSLLNCDDPYPMCAASLNQDAIKYLNSLYLNSISQLSSQDKKYIINKMPDNFLRLGLIHILFPHAKIIHIQRDIADNALSIYFQYFSGNLPYAYDLHNIGIYTAYYKIIMEHWRSVGCIDFTTVNYSDLIDNTDETISAIFDYLDITYDPGCLKFHKNKRTVRTSSNWQVRQPLYRTSLNKSDNYKKYLGPVFDAIDAVKQSEMDRLLTYDRRQ